MLNYQRVCIYIYTYTPIIMTLDWLMPCRRQRHITKHATFGGRVCEGASLEGLAAIARDHHGEIMGCSNRETMGVKLDTHTHYII